jgi:hypothetical protein
VQPGDNIVRIDSKPQARYRSGVGMLLFLTKHSTPDSANFVRDLSKYMAGASTVAYKEKMRLGFRV